MIFAYIVPSLASLLTLVLVTGLILAEDTDEREFDEGF